MRKNKGITLIALIITIIILLILVGVSLNLLIKGDLFGSAEKAVEGTNAKVEEQQTRVDELMGELEKVEAQNAVHNWQYTDETRGKIRCTCARCKIFPDGDSTGRTLSIGQQIGETEYKTAMTWISTEKSGYNADQPIILDNEETKWVVFGYEDKDKDGLNEVLLLTTEHPTERTIYLKGAAAYNNAIEEINRMCKELYGTNARGITIEDVNRVLGYTPTGGMYYLIDTYYTIENLTTKLKNLGDVWTAIKDYNTNNESGVFYDPSHPEGISDSGETLGEYVLDGYEYAAYKLSSNIADSAKAMVFGDSCGYSYWLASRGVIADSGYAVFGPGVVNGGYSCSCYYLFACYRLFSSTGGSSDYDEGLRPLVSLTSEIPAAGDVLFTTFTDESGKPR